MKSLIIVVSLLMLSQAHADDLTVDFAVKSVESVALRDPKIPLVLTIDKSAEKTYLSRFGSPFRLLEEFLMDATNFFATNLDGYLASMKTDKYTLVSEDLYSLTFEGLAASPANGTGIWMKGTANLAFKDSLEPLQHCVSTYIEGIHLETWAISDSGLDTRPYKVGEFDLAGGGTMQCERRSDLKPN